LSFARCFVSGDGWRDMPREGTFVAVVGPSGAGKDSLIEIAKRALADDRQFVFPRRVITRAAEPSEDHISAAAEDFLHMRDAGYFTLHWEAHGLHYGIPRAIEIEVANGRDAIVNLSRGVLTRMRQVFPMSAVIEVTASPATLARRLANRGRETGAEQLARLQRAIPSQADVIIHNDGLIEDAGRAFLNALRTLTARHAIVLGL
jgi:ribose 1,5-bisphosphokinase